MGTKKRNDQTRLTEEQFSRLGDLLGDVDSVEIKLTVPANEHRATISTLALDPVESEPRQVFFFDTPDLALNRAGVVVRARRLPGGRADTVVKLRPVVPGDLPSSLRRSGSFKVEVDCLPGGFVCSGSCKGKAGGDEVIQVAAFEMPLDQLLSREQRAFYRQNAPRAIGLHSLAVLGPIFILKNEFKPKRLGRKLAAEVWLYPDGSRLLELSTKSDAAEALAVAAQLRDYLTHKGVVISAAQETKTKGALAFFARELRTERKPGRARGGATPRHRR